MNVDLQGWFYRGREAARAPNPDAAIDAVLASSPSTSERACRAGCAACCYHTVGVAPVEIESMVAWLLTHLSRASLVELRVRIRSSLDARAAGASGVRHRCVLLGPDDRCSAYEARPVACRAWHSRSVAACEAGFRGDAYPPPEPDAEAYAAGLGAHAGLRTRTAPGSDNATVELTLALARALGAPTSGTGEQHAS